MKRIRPKLVRIWKIIQREGFVVLLAMSIFAGASFFFHILSSFGSIQISYWWMISIAVAMFSLPWVNNQLKNSTEPYLIRIAIAFRAGFSQLAKLAADLSHVDNLHKASDVPSDSNDLTQ